MGVPHPVVMDDHGPLVNNASTSAGDRWDWSQAICHHLGVKNQLGQGENLARKRVTY